MEGGRRSDGCWTRAQFRGRGGGLQLRTGGECPRACVVASRLLPEPPPQRPRRLFQRVHIPRPRSGLSYRHEGGGRLASVCFRFWLLTLGLTPAASPPPGAPRPPSTPPSFIPHPWQHPLHAGVLSVFSTKYACGRGWGESNVSPFAFFPLSAAPPLTPLHPTFEMFLNP